MVGFRCVLLAFAKLCFLCLWLSGCGIFAVADLLKKSGPVLSRPSPATHPENCTNQSADLVEAVSLVICEEITWRPSFFWLSDPGHHYRIEFLLVVSSRARIRKNFAYSTIIAENVNFHINLKC